MAVPQIIHVAVPPWLSQGGKASFPLILSFLTRESLTVLPQYGQPPPTRNSNGMTALQAAFFKLPQSTTSERGSAPYVSSSWVTRESLTKWCSWASRDYALRKICDEWFFGASVTFGAPVRRSPMAGLNGWGGFPLCSSWVSREALTQAHQWAHNDSELQTVMEDWFFGKTEGSADMHILFTYELYR